MSTIRFYSNMTYLALYGTLMLVSHPRLVIYMFDKRKGKRTKLLDFAR
jgi:hypothetical protein